MTRLALTIASGLMALLFLAAPPALAQNETNAQTVAVCGTPNNTPVVGNTYPVTMDTHASLCIAPVTVDATDVGITSPVDSNGNIKVSVFNSAGAYLPLATDAHLTAFTSANHTDLSAINTTLGSPMQQTGGSIVILGDSYNHITTSTTTTIAGPHTLKAVSINTDGTVASTTTVKDGTNTLAVIDSLNKTGTWLYNIACATSIVIVTTGTSPPDVTVTYQ